MKSALLALAICAALPLSAEAANISYSNIELHYLNVDGDADGLGLRGAVNLGETDLYLLGGYSYVEVSDTSVEINGVELGLGFHHEMTSNSDWLAEVAYQRTEANNLTTNGYRVSGGVRGLLSDDIEGIAKLNYRDARNVDGDFSATLGGQYKFTETWGINAEIEFGNDGQSYLIGVRANF
jgi:Ax21 family sulfation-dependent quorum factor